MRYRVYYDSRGQGGQSWPWHYEIEFIPESNKAGMYNPGKHRVGRCQTKWGAHREAKRLMWDYEHRNDKPEEKAPWIEV